MSPEAFVHDGFLYYAKQLVRAVTEMKTLDAQQDDAAGEVKKIASGILSFLMNLLVANPLYPDICEFKDLLKEASTIRARGCHGRSNSLRQKMSRPHAILNSYNTLFHNFWRKS